MLKCNKDFVLMSQKPVEFKVFSDKHPNVDINVTIETNQNMLSRENIVNKIDTQNSQMELEKNVILEEKVILPNQSTNNKIISDSIGSSKDLVDNSDKAGFAKHLYSTNPDNTVGSNIYSKDSSSKNKETFQTLDKKTHQIATQLPINPFNVKGVPGCKNCGGTGWKDTSKPHPCNECAKKTVPVIDTTILKTSNNFASAVAQNIEATGSIRRTLAECNLCNGAGFIKSKKDNSKNKICKDCVKKTGYCVLCNNSGRLYGNLNEICKCLKIRELK